MNTASLLDDLKLHARVDAEDDDADLLLMLATAAADVAHAANYELPELVSALPDDLKLAVLDQATMIFDARGAATDRPQGLSMASSAIAARYRGVKL